MEGVLERLYFPPEKEGGITCIRPFIMVRQILRSKIKRSEVQAVILAARPNRSLFLSNSAEDSIASSKKQNLRFNLKMRRRLQANKEFTDLVPL